MSILGKIEVLFEEIGFHVRHIGDRLIGNFTIGEVSSNLSLTVQGSGDGAILNFELIGLLKPEEVRESQHIGAFLQYLLAQNWQFSAGTLEMDTDGEVRVLVELPLADSAMTAAQLRLVIQILGQNAAQLLQKGRRVLATGSPVSDDAEEDVADDETSSAQDLMQMFERFMAMAETADGRTTLLEMKSQSSCPPLIARLIDEALKRAMPDEL